MAALVLSATAISTLVLGCAHHLIRREVQWLLLKFPRRLPHGLDVAWFELLCLDHPPHVYVVIRLIVLMQPCCLVLKHCQIHKVVTV